MEDKPFSKAHVLRITSMHMKRAIDKSIRKTFVRMGDKPEKGVEIMETLDVLHKMRAMLEEFEDNNKQLYNGDKA